MPGNFSLDARSREIYLFEYFCISENILEFYSGIQVFVNRWMSLGLALSFARQDCRYISLELILPCHRSKSLLVLHAPALRDFPLSAVGQRRYSQPCGSSKHCLLQAFQMITSSSSQSWVLSSYSCTDHQLNEYSIRCRFWGLSLCGALFFSLF